MKSIELTASREEAIRGLLARFELQEMPGIIDLLHVSLIHRSWRAENSVDDDNERLEFLGDAVIGLAATEYLFETKPHEAEGKLSKRRAAMVSRKTLGEIARRMNLGALLLLGTGEENTGGRLRASNLGSGLEAVCGALSRLYQWETLRPALVKHIVIPSMKYSSQQDLDDFKSKLQELTQKEIQTVPRYVLASTEGPEHSKSFRVEVWIGRGKVAEGLGQRKKWAENQAAKEAIEAIESGKFSLKP